jgi:DNA-binding transcriptional ArsR family regulator
MAKRSRPPIADEPGKFAYSGLDRVIHEKARLGIMTSLVAQPRGLAFTDLKELCDLTDGNLNRHLEVLREAGLVEIRKEQGRGRARTFCHMTGAGRVRFLEYLAELERVVAEAAAAAEASGSKSRFRMLPSQA